MSPVLSLLFVFALGTAAPQLSETRFDYILKLDPNDPKAYDKDNLPQNNIPWRSMTTAVRWSRDLWDSEASVKLIVSGGPWTTPIQYQEHRVPQTLVLEAASPSVMLDASLATNQPYLMLLETRNMVVRGFSFTRLRTGGATVWLRNCRNILFDRVTGLTADSIKLDKCEGITFRGCNLPESATGLPGWSTSKGIRIEASPANP